MLAWIVAHKPVVGGLVWGLVDLLFVLSPNLKSSGIVDLIVSLLKQVLPGQPSA